MGERIFRAVLWCCAGVGFDIGDRIFDHILDQWTASVAWLAWLQ